MFPRSQRSTANPLRPMKTRRRGPDLVPPEQIPERLRAILELAAGAEAKLSDAVALVHELPPEERAQVREYLWGTRQHLRDQVARFRKEVERIERAARGG